MNTKAAYNYYKEYILNENKRILFEKYSFPVNGLVSSHDWELFAAILFNRSKQQKGADLGDYEIKSAKDGSNFEYQYHKNCGSLKLREDQKVNHVYISYDNQYKDITVRKLAGKSLIPLMKEWETLFDSNYQNNKQRFRKNVPYSFVKKKAEIIFTTKGGRMVDQ